ncbi:hypothetical protein M1145_03525 [Patescibacteria group bacterium]|nr:hypothetical protein [Patescibacteria group bacterium]
MKQRQKSKIVNPNNISFIYFDLGGVVIIDFSGNNKWNELKEKLKIPSSKSILFDKIFDEYEKQICTNMDIESMKGILNKELGINIPLTYSLLKEFVNRFEKNPSIWPIIKNIKKKYPIGLFTMMYPRMLNTIKESGIIPAIDWNITIDSSIVRYTKYDIEMFDIATKKANVPKKEILLIENSMKHIETAQNYGWQTFFYNPNDIDKSNTNLITYIGL